MPQPLLFLDLETTHLSATLGAPLSISVHVLGGPDNGAEFHGTMRPHQGAIVNDIALKINSFTPEQIDTFPDPYETFVAFRDFIQLLDAGTEGDLQLHQIAGWNIKFDYSFLIAWLGRCADQGWFGNTFTLNATEVMDHYKSTYPDFKTRFGSAKLVDAYRGIFNRPLDKAHTAHADVLATRDIFLHCDKEAKEPAYSDYHHLIQ